MSLARAGARVGTGTGIFVWFDVWGDQGQGDASHKQNNRQTPVKTLPFRNFFGGR